MKKLLIPLLTIVCLVGSATTLANGYRHQEYKGGYGHNSHGFGNAYAHKYRGHYGHRGYRHHRYGQRSHRSDTGAYLLGGLLIGAVISDSYHRARYRQAYPPQRQVIYRTRTVESRAPATTQVIAPGRHLFRDLAGNCFEIRHNDEGDELRSALPAADCDW